MIRQKSRKQGRRTSQPIKRSPSQISQTRLSSLSSFTPVNNKKHVSDKDRQHATESRRRVVVTGMGVVSSLGINTRKVFTSILRGETAIREIDTPELMALNLQTKSFAPVGPITPSEEQVPRHLRQIASRHQVYALVAAHEAMKEAQLIPPEGSSLPPDTPHSKFVHTTEINPHAIRPLKQTAVCADGHSELCDLCEGEPTCAYQRDSSDRLGVCIGSSIGCVEEIGASHVKIAARGGKGAGAYSLPKLLVNIAAGHVCY